MLLPSWLHAVCLDMVVPYHTQIVAYHTQIAQQTQTQDSTLIAKQPLTEFALPAALLIYKLLYSLEYYEKRAQATEYKTIRMMTEIVKLLLQPTHTHPHSHIHSNPHSHIYTNTHPHSIFISACWAMGFVSLALLCTSAC